MPKVVPGKTTVAGFRVLEILGRGGMGAVFLAENAEGTRAALKILTLSDVRARARFLREVRLGQELQHPNLVRVYAGGEFEDSLFLVMELVEGKELSQILHHHGRLSPGNCIQFTRQLAGALDTMHSRGLVHRDLKPDNIMIRKDGVLKLMDLGLVRDPNATQLTKTGSLVGTPWFMAPEQVKGDEVTVATDLFAAGLITYCLLTGRHPFRRQGESDFLRYLGRLSEAEPRPWHPQGAGGPLDHFFHEALARDPAGRFPTAGALAEAFEAAIAEQARGDRSVEETLEMEVDGSGVGSLEDLRPLEDEPPAPPPGAERDTEAVPGVPPASPATHRVGAPPASGRGRWAGSVGAALFAVGVFAVSLLWGGIDVGEVVLRRVEGLDLPDGRALLVVAEGGARLRLGDREPRLAAEDHDQLVFEVPFGEEVLRLRRSSGTEVFAQPVAQVEWRRPEVLGVRFTTDGALEVRVTRPEVGEVGLRRANGALVVDTGAGGPAARFRVADPSRDGFEPLEILLEVAGGSIVWERLEDRPSADAAMEVFVEDLASLNVVREMREAGRGPDAARDLLLDLEERGFVSRFDLLRRRISPVLRQDTALGRGLLAHASKLMLLDAYLSTAGIARGDALRPDGPDGFADQVWRQGFYPVRAEPRPGRLVFPKYKDYLQLEDAPTIRGAEDPTALWVSPFGEHSLETLGRIPDPCWLGIWANEWRGGFFAEVWLNDEGPFYLADDPRADRPALFAAAAPHAEHANPEKRTYWVRLPPGVAKHENRVRIVARPHLHRAEITRPFAILSVVSLEPPP